MAKKHWIQSLIYGQKIDEEERHEKERKNYFKEQTEQEKKNTFAHYI